MEIRLSYLNAKKYESLVEYFKKGHFISVPGESTDERMKIFHFKASVETESGKEPIYKDVVIDVALADKGRSEVRPDNQQKVHSAVSGLMDILTS